jgi:hypothetical protein
VRTVGQTQFFDKCLLGPRIADTLVYDEEQEMLVERRAQEKDAPERRMLQGEGKRDLLAEQTGLLLLAVTREQHRDVKGGQGESQGGRYGLEGLALKEREAGT